MTVSRRRESSGLAILCLAAATLALVFAGCAQAATPEPDARSGPTSTQARQPAQEPTFPAGAQDTDGRTPTIPALTPSQEATEQPEVTTVAEPTQEATERPEATTVASPAQSSSMPFVQVSAGPFHTCGLRADGTIACWGAHGDEERLTESTGLLDSPPGSFSQIDAGHHHSCAIRQDGAVKCWGSMSIEGDDMPPEEKAMMEAMWAPPEGWFISVSAGFLFSCGVRDDNTAECWGLAASFSDALTPPEGEYTSVSVGGFHACGIRTDQTVVCWGSDPGVRRRFSRPGDAPGRPVRGHQRRGLPYLRVQARRGNQVLGEHRGRVPPDLRAATRRHQPVLEGRGGCRGRQSVGRQSGQPTRRQPQGHGQRRHLCVCVVGRWPHRVLGIRRYQ